MCKSVVIDTNVLLNDPQAILKFEDNNIIIPMAVLEELDAQKNSDRGIARDARAAIRQLNDIIGDGDPIEAGVCIPHCGKLYVKRGIEKSLEDGHSYIESTCKDDEIINCALHMQHNGYDTILVSNDVCMRLKAKGIGLIHAQEYSNEVVIDDPDLLPKGFLNIPNGWLETLDPEDVIAKSCGVTYIRREVVEDLVNQTEKPFAINDWLVNVEDGIAAKFEDVSEDEEFFIFQFSNVQQQLMKRKAAGITPRDIYQGIALDALLDKDIDLLIIDGEAGSGKTLLAMAASTEMVKGKKASYRMEEVIFSRSSDSQFGEMGFLPGDESAKMAPWLGGCTDNMEVIARASKNLKFHPSTSISKGIEDEEDAFIKFKSLIFMRGRSLNHRVLILDEAQNLSASQMKTLITRAGEYCKVIIMGNLAQIDNDYVSPRTSGLTYVTEKFHGVPFAKVLCLQGSKRSRLAAFAEENL